MFVSGHLGDRVDLRYFLTGVQREASGCGSTCLRALLHVAHRPVTNAIPSSHPTPPVHALQEACWAVVSLLSCLARPTSCSCTAWPSSSSSRLGEVGGECGAAAAVRDGMRWWGVGRRPAQQSRLAHPCRGGQLVAALLRFCILRRLPGVLLIMITILTSLPRPALPFPAGLLQATGWPSVVSVMANWFGKGKRGLIMGIWNAHTSVGEAPARRCCFMLVQLSMHACTAIL